MVLFVVKYVFICMCQLGRCQIKAGQIFALGGSWIPLDCTYIIRLTKIKNRTNLVSNIISDVFYVTIIWISNILLIEKKNYYLLISSSIFLIKLEHLIYLVFSLKYINYFKISLYMNENWLLGSSDIGARELSTAWNSYLRPWVLCFIVRYIFHTSKLFLFFCYRFV